MRKKYEPQTCIFDFINTIDHTMAHELTAISDRLDTHPEFIDWVYDDIKDAEVINPETGRPGMTAESILRCALLKSYSSFSYRRLEFFLKDSISFKSFIRHYDDPVHFTTLQKNVGAISADTLEKINRSILLDAKKENLEKARMVRVDSTTSQSNIHEPTDSSLLWDSIRVINRLLKKLDDEDGNRTLPYHDHTRVSKKLAYQIQFESRKKKRLPKYKRLIKYAQKTMGYAVNAIVLLNKDMNLNGLLDSWTEEVEHYLELATVVVSQTVRRVIHDEKVPSADKIFSIFEAHTDIIVKGSRNVVFGHKLNLTTGKSGLILDLTIEEGNPADSERAVPLIERQIEIYGRSPRQVAFDGCYASAENVTAIKDLGVKDVAFHKKRGISISDMAKSTWVYKKLVAFRAGIEGNIATLKSRYGMKRVNWKGHSRFKSYLWGSVLTYNLVTLARLEMQIE